MHVVASRLDVDVADGTGSELVPGLELEQHPFTRDRPQQFLLNHVERFGFRRIQLKLEGVIDFVVAANLIASRHANEIAKQ